MWNKIQSLLNGVEGMMDSFSDGEYVILCKRHQSTELKRQVIHAIIHRLDTAEIKGWDELQQVKSSFFGPEVWGYEVYPAESCRVSVVNARHLWLMTPLPFGYRFAASDISESKLFLPTKLVW